MKIKLISQAFLIGGFIWALLLAFEQLYPNSHSLLLLHAQQLETYESLDKETAINALRNLQLDIKKQKLVFVIPAFLMLIGGLLSRQNKNK